jgi:hypothetical protein
VGRHKKNERPFLEMEQRWNEEKRERESVTQEETLEKGSKASRPIEERWTTIYNVALNMTPNSKFALPPRPLVLPPPSSRVKEFPKQGGVLPHSPVDKQNAVDAMRHDGASDRRNFGNVLKSNAFPAVPLRVIPAANGGNGDLR